MSATSYTPPARARLELGSTDGRPLPPGPRRWPLARSLHWFHDPVGFVERWQRQHGPVFRAPLGPRRSTAFVCDPALARAVLTAEASALRTGDGNGLMRPVLGARSLLVLDGEEHRQHRSAMLPTFHGVYVRRFAALVARVTEDRVARWPRGRPIRLHEEMREIAFSAILRIVLGVEPGGREQRLRILFPRVMDGCSSPLTLMPYFRRELRGVSPYGRLMAAVAELDELLEGEIAERLADPRLERRDDALSMLIRAREAGELEIADAGLRDELMTMLVAGHETTAAALAWAFERLARHPDVAARIADRHGAEDDPYLEATIKEVLRQRPLVPALVRKLTVPAVLGNFGFPTGWVLMPAVFAVHHDPAIYPEPDRFRPERFLGDRPPPSWAWIPFGGGNRRCVGASLAMLEMRIVLGTVLRRVELRAPSGAEEGVRRRRFTLAPEREATVIVHDRRVKFRKLRIDTQESSEWGHSRATPSSPSPNRHDQPVYPTRR
jgi:cytochrome P450